MSLSRFALADARRRAPHATPRRLAMGVLAALALGGPVRAQTPSVTFSATTVQGGGSVTGTVRLSSAPTTSVTVTLVSSASTATLTPLLSGTSSAGVVIKAGTTSASFAVATIPVARATAVVVTAKTASASASATLTVQPPTLTGFTVSPATVLGGLGTVGTLALSGPAPSGGLVLTMSSASPSVTVPASVTVAAGAQGASIAVATSKVASAATVVLTATTPAGALRQASLGVQPPLVSSLTLSSTTVPGGTALTGRVSLNAVAPAGGLTVALASTLASVQVGASVTVPEGAQQATFPVTTSPVTTQAIAQVGATLSGVQATAALTITPPALGGVSVAAPALLGGTGTTLTVQLTGPAPASGVALGLRASATTLAVPSTATIAAGQSSVTVAVGTAAVSADRTDTLVVSVSSGATAGAGRATITLQTTRVQSLTLPVASLVGSDSTQLTVTLNGAAPAGFGIRLRSTDTFSLTPDSVTFAPGATTASVRVRTSSTLLTRTDTIHAERGGQVQARTTLAVVAPAVTGVIAAARFSDVDTLANGAFVVTFDRSIPVGAVVQLTLQGGSQFAGGGTQRTVAISPAPFSSDRTRAIVPAILTPAVGIGLTSAGQLSVTGGGGSASAPFTVEHVAARVVLRDTVVVGGAQTVATIETNVARRGASDWTITSSSGDVRLPTTPIRLEGGTTRSVESAVVSTGEVTASTLASLIPQSAQGTGTATPLRLVALRVDSAYVTGTGGRFRGCNTSYFNCGTAWTLNLWLNGVPPTGGRSVSLTADAALGLPSAVLATSNQVFVKFTPTASTLQANPYPIAAALSGGIAETSFPVASSRWVADSIVLAPDPVPLRTTATGRIHVSELVRSGSGPEARMDTVGRRVDGSLAVLDSAGRLISTIPVTVNAGQGVGSFPYGVSSSVPTAGRYDVRANNGSDIAVARGASFLTALPAIRSIALDRTSVGLDDAVQGTLQLTSPPTSDLAFTSVPAGLRFGSSNSAGDPSSVRFVFTAPNNAFGGVVLGRQYAVTASVAGSTMTSAPVSIDTGVVLRSLTLPPRVFSGIATPVDVELTGPAPALSASVEVGRGARLATGASSLLVRSGVTSARDSLLFDVPANGAPEADVDVTVRYKPEYTLPLTVRTRVVLTLVDLCPELTSAASGSTSSIKGGQVITCTATIRSPELVAPAGGLTFALGGTGFLSTYSTTRFVTIPAGARSVAFPVTLSSVSATVRADLVGDARFATGFSNTAIQVPKVAFEIVP